MYDEQWMERNSQTDRQTDGKSSYSIIYRVGQKVSLIKAAITLSILPANFQNGTCTLWEICNRRSPPNTVCETALSCKIVITTLLMFQVKMLSFKLIFPIAWYRTVTDVTHYVIP